MRLTPPDLSRDQAVMDMIHISRFLELDKTDIHEQKHNITMAPMKVNGKRIASVPTSESSDTEGKPDEESLDSQGFNDRVSMTDLL